MENIAFTNVRRSVKESMSSIFTREDVLRIIDSLEKASVSSHEVDFSELKSVVNGVIEAIDNVESLDTSDVDNVELSLHGMEVCVDSVEIVGLESAMAELSVAFNDLKSLIKNLT